jgi:hypothetical protein
MITIAIHNENYGERESKKDDDLGGRQRKQLYICSD